jgi:hypothetical protein
VRLLRVEQRAQLAAQHETLARLARELAAYVAGLPEVKKLSQSTSRACVLL